MNELGQLLHGIPNPGVGVLEIQLVANAPQQQSRMVFVFQHLLLQLGELPLNRMNVIVIHPCTFGPQIQSKHD